MVEQIGILLTAADLLSVPVIITEQYPKGLGGTAPELIQQLKGKAPVIEKTNFSCVKADGFISALQLAECKQVILTGMESHICILQTAMDLLASGYTVFIVEDAVSSRTKSSQYNALQRLRQAGAIVTNIESVLFEWLEDASHPHFKTISKLIV